MIAIDAAYSSLPFVPGPMALGAHHLDLMFSNPADPPDVRAARTTEIGHIRSWVAEHKSRRHQQFVTLI